MPEAVPYFLPKFISVVFLGIKFEKNKIFLPRLDMQQVKVIILREDN